MSKKTRFAFRTTDEFKLRIARVAETLGLDQAVVGEAALEAVVSYVEKYGELTIPIRIERREKKEIAAPSVRSSRTTDRVTGLNEPEGEYPAKKGKRQ